MVGQHRSTQRRALRVNACDSRLVGRMHELVRANPRFGYRRVCALLRGEGWRVNVKRVHRLWKSEGFKVPRRQVRRRRLGVSGNGCSVRRAAGPNDVWAWDFVHDHTSDGRPLKWLTLVDEFTRQCVALEARRSITAADAAGILRQATARSGAPAHLRSDNGPEFIAKAMRSALADLGVATLYVEPGSPWENGHAESFNSKLRDELLNREEFGSALEAQIVGRDWRRDYNERRPHSALGYVTPDEYARRRAVEMTP